MSEISISMLLLVISLAFMAHALGTTTVVKHTQADDPELHGHWVEKTLWKYHWIKHWRPKLIYIPIWKKVWSPVIQKEWIPVPKSAPLDWRNWRDDSNDEHIKALVKKVIE